MSRFSSTEQFQHGKGPFSQGSGTGVLFVNLGTPDEPTTSAVRRYLREFLSDRRIVEIPKVIWWLILHLIILPLRPRKSAAAYKRVWSDAGSPLLAISKQQAAALQAQLPGVNVQVAMRYGNPSIASGLQALRDAGCTRLLVLPAYPQYSGPTTASVMDAVWAELSEWRWIPEVRHINGYYDHPGYIQALANSVREQWAQRPKGEKLLISFHGVPRRTLELGDPYHCHARKTARLLIEELGLDESKVGTSFQSRFGKAEWLQPYTTATLQQWAADGVKTVDVVCPGFSADCLETLDEIAFEADEDFRAAGGQSLRYLPALNDREDHIAMLAGLVRNHCQGWPVGGLSPDPAMEQRAKALGAAE